MSNKKQINRILFFSTIVFMLMFALVFDQNINKGLLDKNIPEKISIEIKTKATEQFSPVEIMDINPLLYGVVIITIIVLIKEKKITKRKLSKVFIQLTLSIKRVITTLSKKVINIQKSIEDIEGLDIKKIIDTKPHKKAKEYYSKNIHYKIYKEFEKLKDLFTAPYCEEFRYKFISILFIVLTVAMSIIAVAPGINKVSYSRNIQDLVLTSVETEQFSPEPLISFWPFIIALIIITIISVLKIKREKY